MTTGSPWPGSNVTPRRQTNSRKHSNGNPIIRLRNPRWNEPGNWRKVSARLNLDRSVRGRDSLESNPPDVAIVAFADQQIALVIHGDGAAFTDFRDVWV